MDWGSFIGEQRRDSLILKAMDHSISDRSSKTSRSPDQSACLSAAYNANSFSLAASATLGRHRQDSRDKQALRASDAELMRQIGVLSSTDPYVSAGLIRSASLYYTAPSGMLESAAWNQHLMLQEQSRRELIAQTLLRNRLQQHQDGQLLDFAHQDDQNSISSNLPPLYDAQRQALLERARIATNREELIQNEKLLDLPETIENQNSTLNANRQSSIQHCPTKKSNGSFEKGQKNSENLAVDLVNKRRSLPLKKQKIKCQSEDVTRVSSKQDISDACSKPKAGGSSLQTLRSVNSSSLVEDVKPKAGFPLPVSPSAVSYLARAGIKPLVHSASLKVFRSKWKRLDQFHCSHLRDLNMKECFVREFFSRKLSKHDDSSLRRRAASLSEARSTCKKNNAGSSSNTPS